MTCIGSEPSIKAQITRRIKYLQSTVAKVTEHLEEDFNMELKPRWMKLFGQPNTEANWGGTEEVAVVWKWRWVDEYYHI